MTKIRVGVVRGGPSSEYAVSLKTGESVLHNLNTERYDPVDILISTHGDWYVNGVRTDLGAIAHQVDVVWNALHGTYGEDGKVQRLLESFNIPYTGSGVIPSALGMHKGLAKERFKEAGLLTPMGDVIASEGNVEETAFHLFRNRHLPVIVKPVAGGSSVATRIARTYEDLVAAIAQASRYGDVLVEEFIEGTEATCCVVDANTPREHFVLYPIEIVPPKSKDFFDYDAKYSGESEEFCPGRFTPETDAALREFAQKAHDAIGARHYSRSDFIISPRGIYVLEINTLPGLTETSLFPKALRAGGVELSEFLDHVITLSLSGK